MIGINKDFQLNQYDVHEVLTWPTPESRSFAALCNRGLAQEQECEDDLHHPRFAVGERLH